MSKILDRSGNLLKKDKEPEFFNAHVFNRLLKGPEYYEDPVVGELRSLYKKVTGRVPETTEKSQTVKWGEI